MVGRSAPKLSSHSRLVATLLVFMATVLSACGGGNDTGVTAADNTPRTEATAASDTQWRVAATEGASFTVSGTQLSGVTVTK